MPEPVPQFEVPVVVPASAVEPRAGSPVFPDSAPTTTTTASPDFLSPHAHANLSTAAASFRSPPRQHRRTPSQQRLIRETLDAVSDVGDETDEVPFHKVNQYTIKENIGHGAFGEVHVAVDQYGKEFAVKQFSKVRMRKRSRTLLMKQGPFRAGRFLGPGPSGPGPETSPFAREDEAEKQDPLHFIREEVAVMKKLNHPNLVELIEVLDDPDQDTLYMVLEMCSKGAVMDVDLDTRATPYAAETCRLFFRDLLLGIEYLHAQNIVHRDIKPANLYVTADDVLKIGDFGVSEIFEALAPMRTRKSAGSPAFQPPELCALGQGDVAGAPCDVWAMGVSLYCLRYGRLPFCADVPAIYDAIQHDTPAFPDDEDPDFVDVVQRLLDKDPATRITIAELRTHPWVTLGDTDPLLSADENCAAPLEPPNALELSRAFTRHMGHLLCVVRAIAKFKALLRSSRSRQASMDAGTSGSADPADLDAQVRRLLDERRQHAHAHGPPNSKADAARVALPPLVIGVGTDNSHDAFVFAPGADRNAPTPGSGVVSESPTAADFDVYQRAYAAEVERIQAQTPTHGPSPTVYSNSIVERRSGRPGLSLASVVAQAMEDQKREN